MMIYVAITDVYGRDKYMNKMRTPKMDVIRFKENDVIVASGTAANTMTWSNFGDGIAQNGIVSYNGQSFTIRSAGDNASLYDALSSIGVKRSTEIDNKETTQIMYFILASEVKNTGVESTAWNGTYAWNGSSFIKQ